MPRHKSAVKRVKTNMRSQKYNTHYKSMLKTAVKRLLEMTDKEQANAELKKTYSLLDTLARKNIIHQNKAANQKSRLAKRVSVLS